MGQDTKIEWCDSTLNLQAGCDGCELWNPAAGIKHCYAGTLTERYGGRPGWPESFDKPKLFLERLDAALRWTDLTGKERTGKPWLNGRPRMIFLDDMGDTFTESLPLDWLAPLLPRMADSTHVFMLLTKRARRMREFSESHRLPKNVWPGVSVTSQATARRVWELWQVRGGGIRWVSAEPLLGPVDFSDGPLNPNESTMGDWSLLDQVGLLIAGGESGRDARPMHPDWVRLLRDQCVSVGVPFFFKQWGSFAPGYFSRADYPGSGEARVLYLDGTTSQTPEAMGGLVRRERREVLVCEIGKKAAGRLLDGKEWSQFPEVPNA